MMRRYVDKIVPALLTIGIVSRRQNGTIRWPIHVLPWRVWKPLFMSSRGRRLRAVGVFRNRPGVVKWIPGRLLPRRWGFYVLGVEIGDRG